MSDRLRVGVVDYLNSRPLARGFRVGVMPSFFVTVYAPPSRVADLLASGDIDVGLVPSIELLRIPGLRLLPGPCVAATREVRSVIALLRRPLHEVRRIALDHNSRTSQALLRILLASEGRTGVELVALPPSPGGVPAGFDAALVIGDPALRVDRARFEVVDLAAWWRRVTGLPFVFAAWAVRTERYEPDLHVHFERSLRFGIAALDEIVAEAARETALSVAEATTYFTENLRFWLGEEEIAGLREFYRRAGEARLGELPEPEEEVWRALRGTAARGPAHPLGGEEWVAAG